MAIEGHCQRCQRPAPRGLFDPTAPANDPSFDDPEFELWEVTVDDEGNPEGLLCPGCLTWEEQEEMAEDMADMTEFLAKCSRCATPVPPDGQAEEQHCWQLIGKEGVDWEWLCPGCLTPTDRMHVVEMDRRAAEELRRQSEEG